MLLESFLEASVRRHADKVALVCGRERVTFAEWESAANRLARGLKALGVRRGDRVAIHLENSIEAAIAVFAVLKAGGTFLMVNPTTKPAKLAFILNDCRARALLLPEKRLGPCAEHLSESPHLAAVVVVSGSAAAREEALVAGKRVVAAETLLADATLADDCPDKEHIDVDLAALVYTSGSTGQPKGVMLTHRNMVAAATSISTYLENRPEDVILSVLPLSFDYGLYQVLMAARFGGTVHLERSFAYPHAIMQRVAAERVTGLPLVPTMLAMLLQMDLTRYDLSNLRYVTNTGAALPVEHIRQLRQRLPHVAVYSMYGLTECKRVAYLPPAEIDARPASVGRAMPNCEVYLVDDAGQRLPAGSTGELVVRGGNVMLGYWERPEETAAALRPGPLPGERVLYSGDLFRTDAEGYLYFVGRKDDIIKSRGEKVSPREVEDVLASHPDVAEAAVLGVRDLVLGQAIHAFVAPATGAAPTAQELLRHCASRLEDFMVPQQIHTSDCLPRTPNGKIDKQALRAAILAPAPCTPPGDPGDVAAAVSAQEIGYGSGW